MKHSEYSPSRMDRIILCPGSVSLCMTVPEAVRDQETSYAAAGTRLHNFTHMSCEALYGKIEKSVHDILKPLEIDDRFYVNECLEYLAVLIKSLNTTSFAINFETKVNLTKFGLPEVYGTVDVELYDYIHRVLHIIDWKFGHGVLVEAYENSQMRSYGAGAMAKYPEAEEIHFHIVQPPKENFDTEWLTVSDLRMWVHTTLAPAIIKSQSHHPGFHPGEKQCRWCDAQQFCRPRLEQAEADATRLFELSQKGTNKITDQEISTLLDLAPAVANVIATYTAEAHSRIMKGARLPGFKIVEGRSNRVWTKEELAQEYLMSKDNIDVQEVFKSKLISPAQAEKLVPGGKKDEELQKLITKPPGKYTLVPESDKRKAINLDADVERKFAHLAVK